MKQNGTLVFFSYFDKVKYTIQYPEADTSGEEDETCVKVLKNPVISRKPYKEDLAESLAESLENLSYGDLPKNLVSSGNPEEIEVGCEGGGKASLKLSTTKNIGGQYTIEVTETCSQ